MVDGDEYSVVDTFCYLGDVLSVDGGVEAAVSARIRNGWLRFRQLAPFLASGAPPLWMKGRVYSACVRPSMIYGCETWPVRVDHVRRLEVAERRMIRWMAGASLRERHSTKELRGRMGLVDVTSIMRQARLRWFGHVERKEEHDWVKRVTQLTVEGARPVGRPQKTWREVVSGDMRLLGLRPDDAADRERWRRTIRRDPSNPAVPENRR